MTKSITADEARRKAEVGHQNYLDRILDKCFDEIEKATVLGLYDCDVSLFGKEEVEYASKNLSEYGFKVSEIESAGFAREINVSWKEADDA